MNGERRWFAERDDSGRVVHLSLVDVLESMPRSMAVGHYRVRSVRSGRYYVAADHELVAMVAFLDPHDTCGKCGLRRGKHHVRHPFASTRGAL